MKKMRKSVVWLSLMALVLGVFFASCKRVYLPAPIIDNGQQISMKSSALSAANSDTSLVEHGVVVNFQAISNGPKISSWQWTFSNSSVLYGKEVSYAFMSPPPSIDSVKLLGVDDAGDHYHTTAYFRVVWSLDGLPAVKWISSKKNSVHSRSYDIVLAFNKAGMRYSGSQYFYIGDMSNWAKVDVPAEDTNYLIIADTLATPVAGDVGKYIAIRLKNLAPGSYKMGAGKIVGGQQIWGQFYDSTMVYFSLSSSGKVILASDSVEASILPGSIGDDGSDPVLRFDLFGDSAIIYTNNEKDFKSIAPFVAFQNSSGARYYAVSEHQVTGVTNWGKVKIGISGLDNNILVMRFGTDTSRLWSFSPNMKNSQYWDGYYKVLKAQFIKTSLKDGRTSWTVEPVRQ